MRETGANGFRQQEASQRKIAAHMHTRKKLKTKKKKRSGKRSVSHVFSDPGTWVRAHCALQAIVTKRGKRMPPHVALAAAAAWVASESGGRERLENNCVMVPLFKNT